jgi:hypothetical protein
MSELALCQANNLAQTTLMIPVTLAEFAVFFIQTSRFAMDCAQTWSARGS